MNTLLYLRHRSVRFCRNAMSRLLLYHNNSLPAVRIRAIVTLILTVSFLLQHLLSPFREGLGVGFLFLFHANIFHLAANVLCLFLLKIRLRLPITLAISFVCSYLPQWSPWGTEPILGFSGVLFAAVGIAWGRAHQFRRMCRYCLLPTIIYGLFPHVALTFHLYTLLLGYAVGTVMSRMSRPSHDSHHSHNSHNSQ